MKTAFIIGITGQDGSYLAELLLEKGYEVHGMKRRSSSFNTSRIDHLMDQVHLHYGDLTDDLSLYRLIEKIRPDEIYNLGAMSHVKVSFELPEYTANVDALGPLRVLEAIRMINPRIRYYQASSSEMYGNSMGSLNENSPMCPVSPYGISKLFGYHITTSYRKAYDIFACNGILFNHESPRRGETFVTKKIAMAVAAIRKGVQSGLVLGNMHAIRDWGHAKDYMKAVWMMMQLDYSDDFVIATGEFHSVNEFCSLAFRYARIEDWERYVVSDKKYFRVREVWRLVGESDKARKILGWHPEYNFESLVKEMVDYEINQLNK